MTVIAQCCCGFTLKKGTIVIAILYMIWSILDIAATAYRFHTLHCFDDLMTATGSNDTFFYELNNDCVPMREQFMLTTELALATRSLLIAGLALASIQVICGIILLFGAIQEIPEILFPWVVVETLVAIVSAVIDIITCIAVITEDTVVCSIIGIVFSMVYVVFSVHFLRIVYAYYQTLREQPKFYMVGKETDERDCAKV